MEWLFLIGLSENTSENVPILLGNSKELVGRTSLLEQDMNYVFSNHITRLRVSELPPDIITALIITLAI